MPRTVCCVMLCRLATGQSPVEPPLACSAHGALSGLGQHQSMMITVVNMVHTNRKQTKDSSSLQASSQTLLGHTVCRQTCRVGSAGLSLSWDQAWVCSRASTAPRSCLVAAAQHWASGRQVPRTVSARQVSPAVQQMGSSRLQQAQPATHPSAVQTAQHLAAIQPTTSCTTHACGVIPVSCAWPCVTKTACCLPALLQGIVASSAALPLVALGGEAHLTCASLKPVKTRAHKVCRKGRTNCAVCSYTCAALEAPERTPGVTAALALLTALAQWWAQAVRASVVAAVRVRVSCNRSCVCKQYCHGAQGPFCKCMCAGACWCVGATDA
jgi:hypothetical protein